MSGTIDKTSIGIDLGGTKIAIGICTGGQVHAKKVISTDVQSGPDGIIESMAGICRDLMKTAKVKDLSGIGVGAAGQVNPLTGDVIYAPNIKWKEVPLAKKLSRELSLPVQVLNDVRAATFAELKYGAGKGYKHFINVFIGTGIGSGFVFNGKLLHGATNSAGEIGHICIDPKGPTCECGKKGCFEAFCSGKGLENQMKDFLKKGKKTVLRDLVHGKAEKVTGHMIGQAAKMGDALTLTTLKKAGKNLGLVFANLHTMVNPDIILLGGGMLALKEFFMPALEATVQKHILPVANRDPLFKLAKFENDAVLIGAGAIFS